MTKKFLCIASITMLLLIAFHTPVFAGDVSKGGIVFRDALYGAAIGALIGGGVYLIDEENFDKKLGAGLVIGTIGGVIFGVVETQYLVCIEKGDVKISAVSLPTIQWTGNGVRYSSSLIRVDF